MITITADFKGDLDLALKELADLDADLQVKAIRAGLVEAVKPTKVAAKALAPRKSGALAQAIGHRSLSASAKARLGIESEKVAILVGANRKIDGVWQGRKQIWHEFGTKNMEAHEFLGPALAQSESGLAYGFYRGLQRFLDKNR